MIDFDPISLVGSATIQCKLLLEAQTRHRYLLHFTVQVGVAVQVGFLVLLVISLKRYARKHRLVLLLHSVHRAVAVIGSIHDVVGRQTLVERILTIQLVDFLHLNHILNIPCVIFFATVLHLFSQHRLLLGCLILWIHYSLLIVAAGAACVRFLILLKLIYFKVFERSSPRLPLRATMGTTIFHDCRILKEINE